MAEGMSVGDAVLNFFADTSNLDVAFARIRAQLGELEGTADESMSAAADSVDRVGTAAAATASQLEVVGENAKVASDAVVDGMDKASSSTRDARGEAMLLGEAFGIHLPRHVTSFVAELPGVGEALQAAFAATAILFLIDALVKGTEKLTNWIENTFIFTQSMKDSDQAVKDANKSLLELAQQIEKDQKALSDFGKTPLALKTEKLKELEDELAAIQVAFKKSGDEARRYATSINESELEKATEKLSELPNVLGLIAGGYGKVAIETNKIFDSIKSFFTGAKTPDQLAEEAIKAGQKAERDHEEQAKRMIDINAQIALQAKEAAAQQVDDEQRAAKASIAVAEIIGTAKIKIWAADAKYQAAFAHDAAEATLKVEHEQAEKEYQLKSQTLQREHDAEMKAARGFQGAGDTDRANKQIEVVKQTNAKIETLDAEHYATLQKLAMASDENLLKLQADAAVLQATMLRAFPGLPDTTRNLLSMNDAAAKLGITLSADLAKSVEEARAALKVMDLELAGGKINTIDHAKAKLALVQAEIQLALATGKSTVALRKEAQALQKEIPEVKSATTTHQGLQKVLTQTDSAFNAFVMNAVSGSESIGAAAMNMAKQMIGALVSYAEKKGAASLAQGFSDMGDPLTASLAPAAFEGAALWFALAAAGSVAEGLMGGGNKGNSNGSGHSASVTRLATGGIVSSPTLFMAGDSQSGGAAEEAILPLSNPEAMRKISNALLSEATLRAAGSSIGMTDPVAISAAANSRQGGFDDASMAKLADHIGTHLDRSGGSEIHHHMPVTVKGLISGDNLGKVMKKMSQRVQNRQSNLHASNSLRVTRRSQ